MTQAADGPLSLWSLFPGPLDITEQLSESDLQARAVSIHLGFLYTPVELQIYLREAYYFLPVFLAVALQQAGEYTAALDWFRTVYDYAAPEGKRAIYPGLSPAGSPGEYLSLAPGWLLDPLNPHAIADTRPGSYLRYTVLALVGCLLDFADSEFSRDTAESLPRARQLYLTALGLLTAAGRSTSGSATAARSSAPCRPAPRRMGTGNSRSGTRHRPDLRPRHLAGGHRAGHRHPAPQH